MGNGQCLIGLVLVATPLVAVMLGPAWVEAVPVLQVLALGGALGIIAESCHMQFDAYGLLRYDLAVIFTFGIVGVALLYVLISPLGIMAPRLRRP